MADLADAAERLDIDVQQVAGAGPFAATRH
jgi:hypothetical protein